MDSELAGFETWFFYHSMTKPDNELIRRLRAASQKYVGIDSS
jgi:hypothetical protein